MLSRPAALLVALAALLGSFLLAAPAHAATEHVVTITAEGVTPKVLTVAPEDTVTFVNEDSSFGYRAVATSENWDLDSGPVGLLPGRSYTHPAPFVESGTYTYRVAEGEPFEGSVVLPAPNAQPAASQPASSAPQPSPAGAGSPSPTPAPAGSGGSGTTGAPPLPGGFGSLDAPAADPPAEGVAPAPAIALPELPGETTAGPLPETAPEPEPGPTALAAVPGRLGTPATARDYGLPAALATVLAAGVASLLVRLLLAEPAARRAGRHVMTGPSPVATVD